MVYNKMVGPGEPYRALVATVGPSLKLISQQKNDKKIGYERRLVKIFLSPASNTKTNTTAALHR